MKENPTTEITGVRTPCARLPDTAAVAIVVATVADFGIAEEVDGVAVVAVGAHRIAVAVPVTLGFALGPAVS